MITSVISATVHDGKLDAAFAFAAKLSAYVKDNYPGMTLTVPRNVAGPLYEVHWVGTVDTLAAYDEFNKKLNASEGYQKLVQEARDQGLFVGSSVTNRLYETI